MYRLFLIFLFFLSGCAFNSYYDIDQAHRRTDVNYITENTDLETAMVALEDYLSPKKDDSKVITKWSGNTATRLTENQWRHDEEPSCKSFYRKITDFDYINKTIVCTKPHFPISGCSYKEDENKEYKVLRYERKWDASTILASIILLGLPYGYTYGIVVEDENKNEIFIPDYEFWGDKVGERPFLFKEEGQLIRVFTQRIIDKAIEDRKEQQRKENAKLAKERNYEKRVGYKFCAERYPVPFGREFPRNCIFWIPIPVIVSQQAPEGTLVRVPDSFQPFFITKNSVDSARADGSLIKKGYFVRTGNYQYMSLLGVRTVQKLKRLPDM